MQLHSPGKAPRVEGNPLVGEKWASSLSGVHSQNPLLLPGVLGAILLKRGRGGGESPLLNLDFSHLWISIPRWHMKGGVGGPHGLCIDDTSNPLVGVELRRDHERCWQGGNRARR